MILLLLLQLLVTSRGHSQPATATAVSLELWAPLDLLSVQGCLSNAVSDSGLNSTCCLLNGSIVLQSGDTARLPSRLELRGDGSCRVSEDLCSNASSNGNGWSPSCNRTAGGELPTSSPPGVGLPSPASSPDAIDADLDLASLTGAFLVPFGSRVTLRHLQLRGAALPTSYPLQAESFLALSAFIFAPPPSPPPPGPMTSVPPPAASSDDTASTATTTSFPPLILQHLTIATPSCAALALHQAFACAASPSPNFTVTPDSLVVHRFTGPTTDVTNVTLRCEDARGVLPFPCLADSAATGPELLAALADFDARLAAAADNGMPTMSMPAYLFLTKDVSLAPGTAAAEAEAGSIAPPPLRPPSPNAITLSVARTIISGDDSGLTVLDLADTTSLISLQGSASVTLRSMTLRNPPLGPPDTDQMSYLRAHLWTFAYSRRILSMSRMSPLTLQSVILELPGEELATWSSVELDGFVPPELQANLCVSDVPRPLLADDGQVLAIMGAPGNDSTSAGGSTRLLFISAKSSTGYRFILTNVTMAAADGPAWSCDAGGGVGAAAGDDDDNATAPLQPSICSYIPEGACGGGITADLRYASILSSGSVPGLLNAASFDPYLGSAPFAYWTLTSRSYGIVGLQYDRAAMAATLQEHPELAIPGFVTKPSVLMGSFGTSVALNVNLLPAAVVLAPLSTAAVALATAAAARSPPGTFAVSPPQPARPPLPPDDGRSPSLTIRAVLLANLPAAGVFPGGVTHGAPSAGSPTQGLPAALTNFTSCLWTVDFDRLAAQARYDVLNAGAAGSGSSASVPAASLDPRRPVRLPFVYLDTVVLLVPQRELDALAWVWARAGPDAAGAVAMDSVTADVPLARQLGRMLTGSRLSQESAAAVAQLASDSGSRGSRGVGLSRLTFERFWWCGVEGRDVVVVSQLPHGLDFQSDGSRLPLTVAPLELALPFLVPYQSSVATPPLASPPPEQVVQTSMPPPPRPPLMPWSLKRPMTPSLQRQPPSRRPPPPHRRTPPPTRRGSPPAPPPPRRSSPPAPRIIIKLRPPPPVQRHKAPPPLRRTQPPPVRRRPPPSHRRPAPRPRDHNPHEYGNGGGN